MLTTSGVDNEGPEVDDDDDEDDSTLTPTRTGGRAANKGVTDDAILENIKYYATISRLLCYLAIFCVYKG
jgi:hypothetical protein